MYIGDYLGRRAVYSPQKLAIVDTGKNPELRLTYHQMNKRADCLAYWLQNNAEIKKGDRIAILAHDGLEHLDLFFACGKLGAIHTALNWRLHWRELLGILQNVTPTVLIYSPAFTETVNHLVQNNTSINTLIHLNEGEIEDEALKNSFSFNYILTTTPHTPQLCETLEAKDTAALIFTGGTTGLPKGACVSHSMIAWNTLNTVIHDLTHDDILLNVFPLFHTGGLFVYTLPQIILGGTIILVKQFEPALILSLFKREKVTVFGGVPAMYQLLTQAENWQTADLSSLRFCTSGGAPLPVPLVEKYTTEKGIRFKQGFGMTEFGPGVFALAPEDAISRAGSIGRPTFFVDARIVDPKSNQPLGPNQPGELVLKGPSAFSGYFNNPQASAKAVDATGWFHTGDMAKYDEDNYFYIVDRLKDMFISGGENIYPAEIEAVLYRHAAVYQCAVIGIPHPKWGEVGKACIVLNPNHTATQTEILTYLKANLAKYKVPKSVEFLGEMPISGAGKILKRELKKRFA